MIVYVESNFVLELALEQEQMTSANTILTLAENGKITLAFPSFVLSEPFESIMRERRDRNSLHDSLMKTLARLQRSESHKRIILDLGPVTNVLREAALKELELLHVAFERLLGVGECLDLDVTSFREALSYQQILGLAPQDSIIYATIIADLKRRLNEEQKCFLSRDMRAFDNSDDRSIKAEMELYNCRYIGSFTRGLDFIERNLQKRT